MTFPVLDTPFTFHLLLADEGKNSWRQIEKEMHLTTFSASCHYKP
jgi:hypothetical protein